MAALLIPLLNAVRSHNFSAAPALLIALVAALIGAGMRLAFARSGLPGRLMAREPLSDCPAAILQNAGMFIAG